MSNLRTLDGVEVAGRRVVVRADLNVPMEDGRITDEARIRSLLPTLMELAEKRASIVVLSHFGRPNGKVVTEYSLEPIRQPLEARVGCPVHFVATDWSSKVEVPSGNDAILLMENTRFHPGEEANDPAFSRRLADLGDIFVNDAFSVSHRAHASTEGIARLIPPFAGRSLQAELFALESALGMSARPIGAVVGGAKVSTKLEILQNLVKRVDLLFVGGGMANTFLHSLGFPVGRSICEYQLTATALHILKEAQRRGCDVILPRDAVVAPGLARGVRSEIVDVTAVPPDAMILDIGSVTVTEFVSRLADLKTLVWNGPLGAFEIEPFGHGTVALAKAAARLTKSGHLVSVAGGGDTLAALGGAGAIDDFSYVSTAGGAFLEWLEGRKLPGVEVLLSDIEVGT